MIESAPAQRRSTPRRGLKFRRIALFLLFVSPDDPSLGQVIGGHLQCDLVAGKNTDKVLAKLAAEMAEAMKAYYPWRVMFINGEYKANGIEGDTFPYPLDGKE